ncbi:MULTISPECIES: hypothetical protein [Oligella]|uniref:DUF3592 domain-containing protein n=2 Tax=Oligella urethralis TaxID=90245 RepID=A0A095Z2Q9_9BURK|nr:MULTISPECIES: hypothetical protein [Oligella]AVL71419.1 hypothetical protein CEQ07_08335 [Oligella urethralis]KGF29000.1 hypothetical protein HMPREF2130_09055 [Oligella urethralis DNF00040]OFS82722.1 hypothetical protein HMPREF3144_10260 [Oligella sp. HMSC05A10]OFV50997.1 hypothetical protein HMPREF3179_01840 [Oligella sp. HMSC09E12]WOS38060.1 hypothetical protein RP300_01625 [Oligella urethralis]
MFQSILQSLIWAIDKVWPVPILVLISYLLWHVIRVALYSTLPILNKNRGRLLRPELSDICSVFWWIIPLCLCFVCVLCSLLLVENTVVRAVSRLGQATKATVIKREVADVEVNYQPTDRLTLSYTTADQQVVESSYLSSSYRYYPIREVYRLPVEGSVIDIKYLPYRLSVFIILQANEFNQE